MSLNFNIWYFCLAFVTVWSELSSSSNFLLSITKDKIGTSTKQEKIHQTSQSLFSFYNVIYMKYSVWIISLIPECNILGIMAMIVWIKNLNKIQFVTLKILPLIVLFLIIVLNNT